MAGNSFGLSRSTAIKFDTATYEEYTFLKCPLCLKPFLNCLIYNNDYEHEFRKLKIKIYNFVSRI